jgi:hypothetical protein
VLRFKDYDPGVSIMFKKPFEKKKSGPGGASPPPTADDFKTGNLPAPGTGMPRTGFTLPSTSSSSSSSPRPGALPPLHPTFKPQHLQVVDDFAVDYAKTLQASDEEYRRTHAFHPHESLMSIHKRKTPDSDLLKWKGARNIPMPITYVHPDFVFRQAAVPGAEAGICLSLCNAFMRYRCMGVEVREIFAAFRKNPATFVRAHKAVTHESESRHPFNTHYERLFDCTIPSRQYQFLEAFGLPDAGSLPRNIPEKKSAPEIKMCPLLVPVGHFEIDRNRPLTTSSWMEVNEANPAGQPDSVMERALDGKRTPLLASQVQMDSRKVKAALTIPRMDAASRHSRATSGRHEDAEEPDLGAHLFAAMNRTFIEPAAGAAVENLPLFLLWITPMQGVPHVVVAEFNTANGKITTPRGIFDPNYGWLGAQRAFNSLDFNLMLHSVFLASADKLVVLRTRGLITAFQLHRVRSSKN